jgi:acetyl-CoA synthetase
VLEVAAVAVSPDGGPSSLVIYAVRAEQQDGNREDMLQNMQQIIRREMNPLFKIHDLVIVESLPKTGSNKIARKFLREQWVMLKSRTVIEGDRPAVSADDHAQYI